MACKGSLIRNSILDQLRPLLWHGLVEQAVDYLRLIPENQLKNQEELLHLIRYLGKNRPMIPAYERRRRLGLRNSSNRGEKAKDLLVADQQKNNGMSWSKAGSVALASVTALKKIKNMMLGFRQVKWSLNSHHRNKSTCTDRNNQRNVPYRCPEKFFLGVLASCPQKQAGRLRSQQKFWTSISGRSQTKC
ncbi:hypothetical protein WDW89_19775 [Deltaproteobacteria bacterium TL4]